MNAHMMRILSLEINQYQIHYSKIKFNVHTTLKILLLTVI